MWLQQQQLDAQACVLSLEKRTECSGYLCRGVLYFKKPQNGGPIICYCYVSNIVHQHLRRHASFVSDQLPISLQKMSLTSYANALALCSCICIYYDGTSTLSSPTGPSELFTMFATAATAMTLAVRTSWPDVLSPCNCNAPGPWIPAILLSSAYPGTSVRRHT